MRESNRCFRTRHVVIAVCVLLSTATSAFGQQLVCDVAQQAQRPDGAPRYSDVSMRLFRKHEGQAELAAAEAFHITRADWCYIRDKTYIERLHARGWTFQGATNAVTTNPEFALKDEEGKPVLDHFKKPGRYWADCRNEAYRDWYVAELEQWVQVGVDSIQRDEPTAIRHWPIPDAVEFFGHVHSRLETAVGRKVPMSVNLAWNRSVFGGDGEPITRLFDFGMAEIGKNHVRPEFFREAACDARNRGKFVVYTSYADLGVPAYRRAIAGCYANGMLMIVPWDQYAGTKAPRVFSTPETLADLYGFVRGNADYLDGYEDAAIAGHGLDETRYGDQPQVVLESGGQVSAWVRARPGDRKAPIVVHLIDWDEPGAFRAKLRTSAFFSGSPLAVELRTPVPYNRELHDDAEAEQSYEALVATTPLRVNATDAWSEVEIPELDPWGMLIVRPAN